MIFPKTVANAASVVAQNKKDRVRVLDRGACSKSSDILHQPAFFWRLYQRAAKGLERRSKTALSNRTQGYVA